ncbi:hypothetical protein EV127DRAFT_37408 [Xylaria flabelliformis]|nr:hypothetical protein EV127DRAFT_37408 [Xylaria flabelliformis]
MTIAFALLSLVMGSRCLGYVCDDISCNSFPMRPRTRFAHLKWLEKISSGGHNPTGCAKWIDLMRRDTDTGRTEADAGE